LDIGSSGHTDHVHNPRQVVRIASHPQARQIDADALRSEIAAAVTVNSAIAPRAIVM